MEPRRVQPAVEQPFQDVLVGGRRSGFQQPEQSMHVSPKSAAIAHRVTPRAIPAASTWLASRRNPDDPILTIRALPHL
jgi:hypothetical protein